MADQVLIAGAGMAGLAAHRRLKERGASVQILEAASIAGGRARLEPERIGIELGPSYLHCADRNPLVSLARELGFELVPADGPELCFGLGDPIEAGRRMLERVKQLETRIEEAADSGVDRPLSELSIHRDEYDALAEAMIGPLSMGLDLDRISILDYVTLVPERGDLMVREGLDELVGRLALGAPILFDTPVERIEWMDDGARAVTPRGTFEADRVVVAVSTGVLRSRSIVFDPPLPIEVTNVFDALPMATFEKIILGLELAGIEPNTRARDARDPHRFEWLLAPQGRPLAVALIGGASAVELLGGSDEEAIDAAVRALSRMLERPLAPRAARVTRFHREPRFAGSWSVAKPGAQWARKSVRCGALSFAGEAFEPEWGTSLTGAWLSGVRAAEEILAGARRRRRSRRRAWR